MESAPSILSFTNSTNQDWKNKNRSIVMLMPLQGILLPSFNYSILMYKYMETTKDKEGRGAVFIMLIINY